MFWGLNNSNDFPNLAQSRMWMAALERNCNGFIWLSVCFFIGRIERERERERGRVERPRRGEEEEEEEVGEGGREGVCFLSEQSDDGGCSEQIISFR